MRPLSQSRPSPAGLPHPRAKLSGVVFSFAPGSRDGGSRMGSGDVPRPRPRSRDAGPLFRFVLAFEATGVYSFGPEWLLLQLPTRQCN